MKVIEVCNLTRDFKNRRALDHITFDVNSAEVFGFLGPNGAGKTTTLKILTGLLRPTEGTAKVAGWDIDSDQDKIKSLIGVVFEFQNVYKRLSARDNLYFSARLYGVDLKRVDQVLRQVGLVDRAGDKVKNFSNGMVQRLMIARALLHKPEIIFMDETTKGLDPATARSIRKLISDLSEQGVTIFLTTHYMEEAEQICHRVAIIDHGKVVVLGTPDNLKTAHGGPGATLEDVFIRLTGNELYQ